MYIFAFACSSTDDGVEHGRVHVEMFDENARQFVFDHQTIENGVPLNSELFALFQREDVRGSGRMEVVVHGYLMKGRT